MPETNSPESSPIVDLSVIITAHSEGILIHKTLASVRRAMKALTGKYSSEIILHADNPSRDTSDYLNSHKSTTLHGVQIFQNSFGDLGESRNFAIQHAKGTYIATIDADDIMCRDWLVKSLDVLIESKEVTVAHSEFTVEFEGANSLILKHGEIDKNTDTLLSVYANRWNSVIVAPRDLLLQFPYAPNTPGYGYEDWHLNCRLIEHGVHNILIPETVIFVRRKLEHSEWLRQKESMAVLRANPLLSFAAIRSITLPHFFNTKSVPRSESLKPLDIRGLVEKYPLARKAVRHMKIILKSKLKKIEKKSFVPHWLQEEWRELHALDKQIFLSPEHISDLPLYDSLTPEHTLAGKLYKEMVDSLRFNTYDYLLFVPWLVKGGADKYSIDYANTIAKLNPNKRVLVVSTLPVVSPWKEKLSETVDFLDFGILTENASPEMKYRLISHLIENGKISHLHVINSEFGYNFIRLHAAYLQASNKKIIATAFSQSKNKDGRIFGYSHTHIPYIYPIASLITSDNKAVIDMWKDEYGFDPSRLVVHHQPVEFTKRQNRQKILRQPLRVLWAARVAPEKLPELLTPIGKKAGSLIELDIYGTVENGYAKYINNLPKNLHYKGTFDGFRDIDSSSYDCLLYTSLFDGMPNILLEAAADNLPIVASAVGGIPEFIKDHRSGLLVSDIHNPESYARALHELSDDPSLRSQLSEEAQIVLEDNFSKKTYEASIKSMLKHIDY